MNTLQKYDHVQLTNYELIEKIGEGGYGFVFKARQLSTGQVVAIKMLRNQETLDESTRKHQHARFERETQLCAEINHPHIVKLLDKGFTDENEPFAVFEFVEGQTLKDLILEKNGLTAAETGFLMGQVLDALASAHAKGVIHRDLKPHNIMVTQTGARSYVKVLDFGIGAFASGFRSNDYRSLTLTQEVVGTPAYCAPEQLRGEPSTPRSDLYSWGLIVLECLTGQPVVQGNGVAELFQQQLNAANVPLPASVAGHPLADLLRKVLEKNPRTRIANSNKLLKEFSEINLSTLVGVLNASTATVQEDDVTLANPLAWKAAQSEKRQLTILCLKLDLSVSGESVLDLETLDTIQRDQINLCSDTAIRFGGYIAGTLSNQVMVYFGYPNVSENDARRAGRTVLELVSEVKKRSALLFEQHGLRLAIRASIHTGSVLVTGSDMPVGMATDEAFRLLYATPANQVMVSESAKKLLDPFLTFDEAPSIELEAKESTKTHLLTGERQTEALSFLRPRSASQQMVGRGAEKARLIELWDQVKAGSGKAALVRGEAGIGKSRLIYEIKRHARDENILVQECRCFPEHQNNALYPFFEALKKSIGIIAAENSETATGRLEKALIQVQPESVETLLPIFCSWLSIPMPEGYSIPEIPPAEQKVLLMNTMEQLLVTLDADKPFIFIIEDLHWLDPTSREFIEQLLGHLEQSGYLMLMTTRPEFESAWSEEQVHPVQLKELDYSDAEVLIQNILGESGASKQALQYITDRTDGIPLFIEELTHMLLDRNYLKIDGDHFELIEGLEDKRVPVSLKDLLQARLDNLSLAKETAQMAATIGREFDYELLVKSSLRDEALVQSDLEQLLNSDLIFRQRRVEGEHYIFRHALIADAAYDSLTSSNKKEVHGRVADTVEYDFPKIKSETPFVLAKHYGESQRFAKAIDLGIVAARKALDRYVETEALEYTHDLLLWQNKIEADSINQNHELSIYCIRTNVLMNKFGWAAEEVKEVAFKAYELLQQKGYETFDLSGVISAYWVLFTYYHVASQRDKVDTLTKEMIGLSAIANDPDFELSAKVMRGIHSYMSEDLTQGNYFKEAIQLLQDTRSLFAVLKDKKPAYTVGIENFCWAFSSLGCALWLVGNQMRIEGAANGEEKMLEGRRIADEAVERAESIEHPPSLCLMHFYRAIISHWDKDKTLANVHTQKAMKIAGEHNLHAYMGYAVLLNAWANDDIATIDATIHQLEQMGCELALTDYKSLPAEWEFKNGKEKEAVARIDACLALCDKNNENYYRYELLKLKEAFVA